MVGYRRMGNVEKHLANATSITSLHHLWRSPRGTVLRIQALALVAIVLSFFLVVFGSCRRWSNRWIVQKGFLAAQVLSLSIGTYSIGLMQSSSVKSEMYPVWAVSLLTLFGCMDPVASYNDLDYKGPLLKVIFQLCLYCGYVVLMIVSSISGVVGHLAIGVLSAITFIKGFHRSLALVLPSRKQNQLGGLEAIEPKALQTHGHGLKVHLPICHSNKIKGDAIQQEKHGMDGIYVRCEEEQFQARLKITAKDKTMIQNVCLSYSLSHLLQRHFLRLDPIGEMFSKKREFESLLEDPNRSMIFKRILTVTELELAFLYEMFFTSNEFIHYYEAKTSSFLVLASFIGICLVGVAAAIPGTLASLHRSSSAIPGGSSTVVVDTTTADLIVTLVILVSLALLQLVQLIRCWTSNWARVAFACEYTEQRSKEDVVRRSWWWLWMRLKAFVVRRVNLFDDKYLWQDKLGQYSLPTEISRRDGCCRKCLRIVQSPCRSWICDRLAGILGLQYIGQVLRELWGSDAKGGAAVKLHDDVKTSIVDFLCQMTDSRVATKWWYSLFCENDINLYMLPYAHPGYVPHRSILSDAYAVMERILVWHIATWYCELAEQEKKSKEEGTVETSVAGEVREKNRRVAIALSKYCAYLMVSAPELLLGPVVEIKRALDEAMEATRKGLATREWENVDFRKAGLDKGTNIRDPFLVGVYYGKMLRNETPPPSWINRRRSDDPWELLALLWVQILLVMAPYGNTEAHRQHLSKGGQFITHIWALLYHLGFDKWEDGRREWQMGAPNQ